MNSRGKLRKDIRNKRRSLDYKSRSIFASIIANRITHLISFRCSHRIACYLSNDGEVDTQSLINRIWKFKKSCYLPILNCIRSRHLFFAPYLKKQQFIKNKFGILEPAVSPKKYLSPTALDIVFVPLVAFDSNGNRVGMGGGFYDTSFAFLQQRKMWHKPKLIGIAYDFQNVESILPEPWDIPLDGVVTEKKYYSFSD